MAKSKQSVCLVDSKRYIDVAHIQEELISIYDKYLKIKWVNEAFASFFAKSRAELIGKSILELIPKSEHKKLRQLHKSLINKAAPKIVHLDEVIDPDGNTRWQNWKNIAVFDDSGKFIEFRAVGSDATEMVEIKNRLKQLENISHELDLQNTILIGQRDNKQVLIKLSDVFYIKANLKVSEARVADGFVTLPKSLLLLEKELAKHNFFRIHKSYLVSLDKIERLETVERSRFKVYVKHIEEHVESSIYGAKKLREHSLVCGVNFTPKP